MSHSFCLSISMGTMRVRLFGSVASSRRTICSSGGRGGSGSRKEVCNRFGRSVGCCAEPTAEPHRWQRSNSSGLLHTPRAAACSRSAHVLSGGCGSAGAAQSGHGRAWRCASGGTPCPPTPPLHHSSSSKSKVALSEALQLPATSLYCLQTCPPPALPAAAAGLHQSRRSPATALHKQPHPHCTHYRTPAAAPRPAPTPHAPTRSRSGSSPWLVTALALADSSVFCTTLADFFTLMEHCRRGRRGREAGRQMRWVGD